MNKSAVHWDILKDMKKDGEIYSDVELIYRRGEFLKDFSVPMRPSSIEG